MNKFIKRLVVLSVMFIGISSYIYACPAGMVELPGGVCLPPDHQNSPLNNLPSASPPPVWADRWGAIASDGNGTYGFVTDMRSKRRAEKAAIEDCKKDGGGACSVRLAFFNQCAVVMAGSKAAATASAATKEEAVELGKKTCRENGDNACSVYWSGCSTAVRVN